LSLDRPRDFTGRLLPELHDGALQANLHGRAKKGLIHYIASELTLQLTGKLLLETRELARELVLDPMPEIAFGAKSRTCQKTLRGRGKKQDLWSRSANAMVVLSYRSRCSHVIEWLAALPSVEPLLMHLGQPVSRRSAELGCDSADHD
jgi:hypothetical protein